MGVITAVAIGAAATAAAGAYAAVETKKASDKASSAQKKAVTSQAKLLKKLDPDVLNSLAQRIDKERAVNRLAFQKEIDPELAQLRELSKKQLLEGAMQDPSTKQSQKLADSLYNETKDEDPRMVALKNSLIDNAEQELAAGATLPPEFQAELVRAGLNTGAQSGVGFSRDTVGPGVSRLIGEAGIQLKAARQDQAMQLTGAAQELTNARVNILASVFPKLRDLETQKRNEEIANLSLAESLLPEVGLNGQDAVNAQIAKVKGQSALAQRRADIKGAQAMATAQFRGEMAGAAAGLVSSAAGAYGSYAGAASSAGSTSGISTATNNMGTYGSRTPQQQQNYDMLSAYYQ